MIYVAKGGIGLVLYTLIIFALTKGIGIVWRWTGERLAHVQTVPSTATVGNSTESPPPDNEEAPHREKENIEPELDDTLIQPNQERNSSIQQTQQQTLENERQKEALLRAEKEEEWRREEKARRLRAEIDATYTWLKLATDNAVTIYKNLGKIPLAQRLIEIAEQAKLPTESQKEAQQDLDQLRDKVNHDMSGYIENIKKIGRKHEYVVTKVIDIYQRELFTNSEHKKIKILDESIRNHLAQYRQYNKIDLEQWKDDLKRH